MPRSASPVVRPGTRGDRAFVRKLSAQVFSRFGDYDRLLPALLDSVSVATVVLEIEGVPAGFLMIDPTGGPEGEGDLIAIAVDPVHQGHGHGGALLRHAESVVRRGALYGRGAIWLTVADDNPEAKALFDRSGYRVVDPDHGRYEGGQRSIAMRKDLG
jgi:ribosomal protein S18 acetylase RimI-like enzyme